MTLFLALVALIVLLSFIYYKETLGTEIDESNSRNVVLARQVRDLSFENKQLKDLRKQEVHNNTILVKENMKLQDRYDELDNLISSLDSLMDELTDKNYIEQLELIKFEAQNEFEEVSKQLSAEQEKEYAEMNYQYERSVI